MGDRGTVGGLLDADRFLGFAQRLRRARERIDAAALPAQRRITWRRVLMSISRAAQHDLDAADRRLVRLETELDRHLG